jgi:Zn-finger domain-containing protein
MAQTPYIDNLIARSRRALDSLNNLKEKMSSYKGFFDTLIKLK